jgi:hypothetical protein
MDSFSFGDFNLHLIDLTNHKTYQFLSLCDSANLKQCVPFSTRRGNHILDLVITRAESSLQLNVLFSPGSPSGHFSIFSFFSLSSLCQ